jgi:hypothetical protein
MLEENEPQVSEGMHSLLAELACGSSKPYLREIALIAA